MKWINTRTAIIIGLILALVGTPAIVYAVNYDNGGRAMQVSVYGKGTVAGDTPITVTGTALDVNVTGTSGTGSVNVAQWGGTNVLSGAAGQPQVAIYDTGGTTVNIAQWGNGDANASTLELFPTGTFNLIYNGVSGTWDRMRSTSGTSLTTGVLATVIHGFDVTSSSYKPALTASADAQLAAYSLQTNSGGYNGTTVDRWRNNSSVSALASAARTTSTNCSTLTNWNGSGRVALFLNVTANPGGAETLQLAVYGVDPISSTRVQLVLFNTIAPAANAIYGFLIDPSLTTALGPTGGTFTAQASAFVPRSWSCQVIHSAAGSWTYSLGVSETQ